MGTSGNNSADLPSLGLARLLPVAVAVTENGDGAGFNVATALGLISARGAVRAQSRDGAGWQPDGGSIVTQRQNTAMAQDVTSALVGLIPDGPPLGDVAGVRALTPSEIDEVSGGPGPLVAFAAGVGAGLVANWIWDAWGEEISEAGEAVYDTLCGH